MTADGGTWALVSPAAGRLSMLRLAPGTARFVRVKVDGEPSTLAKDREGRVWLGTTNGALLRWDGTQFAPDANLATLRGAPVLRITFDASSQPWVVQEREGGVRFHQGKAWRSFTRRNGLLSNRSRDVAVGPSGTVWVASDEGVTEYTPSAESAPVAGPTKAKEDPPTPPAPGPVTP